VAPDGSFGWGKNESFSIEYWVKRDSQAQPLGSIAEVVVGRDDTATGNLSWWTGVLEIGGVAAFELADKLGNAAPILQGSTGIADGAWHHVVAVRDAETNLNLLYVDGQLEDSEQFTYQAGFENESANLNIGWLNRSSGFYFAGAADEVALYRRALSLAEIQEHYNNGLGGQGPRYCVDSDNDGSSDGEENGGPNNGDGNTDGTSDSNQNFVATLLTQDQSKYVTLVLVTPAGGALSNCQAVVNPSPGDAPTNTTFPLGFFEFTINGLVAFGDPAQLNFIFPAGTDLNTYYKYGPPLPGDPVDWYEFLDDGATGATLSNDQVILDFVDGGRGDDTVADGIIVDQGGPGMTPSNPPVADAGLDQTALVGDTVLLDGSGSSDADGDPLTYSWSFSSRPVGSTASLSDSTVVNPTFVVDVVGAYDLQLIVNDGSVDSGPDTVTISTGNLFDIYPVEGTIGTELAISGGNFGEKKGKVTVGTSKCKVLEWTDTSISCLLNKVSSTTGIGTHEVTVKPKGKKAEPMMVENAFSIMAPDIQAVTTSGNSATITGLFFGTKKVKAYLVLDGNWERKKMKVTSLQMDPGTGVSQLEATVSNKVWKKLEPGSYDVIVTNKVGSDTFPNGLTIE